LTKQADYKVSGVYGISVDKATLSFSIGIIGSLLLMLLLVTCVLLALSNRKRRRRYKCTGANKAGASSSMPRDKHKASEVNLYYTCEGSGQLGDEEDSSLFKFTRFLKKTQSSLRLATSAADNQAGDGVYANGPRIYENQLFEKRVVEAEVLLNSSYPSSNYHPSEFRKGSINSALGLIKTYCD